MLPNIKWKRLVSLGKKKKIKKEKVQFLLPPGLIRRQQFTVVTVVVLDVKSPVERSGEGFRSLENVQFYICFCFCNVHVLHIYGTSRSSLLMESTEINDCSARK